jgi:CxxC-x17-CxxC domain-containing protein
LGVQTIPDELSAQKQDKRLVCRDCSGGFTFTAQEQQFFAEKGLVNEPKRCNDCRIIQRARRAGKEIELFEVVCAECGITTKVSFKPTGKKPVLCTQCMHKPLTV